MLIYTPYSPPSMYEETLKWRYYGKHPNSEFLKARFDFAVLPSTLQFSIYEKFSYVDFAEFDECSKFSHSWCKTSRPLNFLHCVEEIELSEEGVLIRHRVGREMKIMRSGFDFDAVPNVVISTECVSLRVQDIFNEGLNFLLKYVSFCNTVHIWGMFPFPEKLAYFFKKMNPFEIKIGGIESPMPREDFSCFERVKLRGFCPLSIREVFRIKSSNSVSTEKCMIIYKDFVSEIQSWSRGEFCFPNSFNFLDVDSKNPVNHRRCAFSLKEFQEEMKGFPCKVEENRDKYAVLPFRYEWTIERKDSEEKLIVDYIDTIKGKHITVELWENEDENE